VADALTLANGVFGFLAILTWAVELGPLQGRVSDLHVAAAYIALGVIADGVDGIVARAWGSTGLGEALDSINDAITFSVAPAVLLVNVYETANGPAFRTLLSLSAVALVLAGMLRLALHQEIGEADAFSGLPTPWSAAALVTIVLVGAPAWAAVGTALVLAVLNLSNVPYPKTRGKVFTRAALVLAAASLAVITGLLLVENPPEGLLWGAAIVALGLVGLAPLATRFDT
jgi:CDP-diacylglycerol--serine O-phosphatidyltransferase